MDWLACEAKEREFTANCCRVCKANILADSSFISASVSLSAPSVNTLIKF